jgi:hypothetical protein
MSKLDFLRLSPGAALVSLAASSPALKAAFYDHTMQVQTALTRFFVITVVVGIGWAVLRSIVAEYGKENDEKHIRESIAKMVNERGEAGLIQAAVLPVVVDMVASQEPLMGDPLMGDAVDPLDLP